MGIPSYFSYIVKNYPHILSKFVPKKRVVDNLYLDCNSIIYDVYHKLSALATTSKTSVNPDHVIEGTIQKIREYIDLVAPQKTVYIAFDGVAPVAKIEQQRSRRFKSWYLGEATNHIYQKPLSNKTAWSTLAITPGTTFMSKLDADIKEAFINDKDANNKRTIIFSGSKDAGEGEHKLFDYIRQNPVKHKDETTVIYGLDADLIVLSICHLIHAPNIFLFRESPHFHLENLEPNSNYMLDIQRLVAVMDVDPNDYIVLTFLLGNDFLPHFPALNIRTGGMDKLMLAYQDLFKRSDLAQPSQTQHLTVTINNQTTIHWKNMHRFIAALTAKEELYFQEEHKLRNRRDRVMPARTADEAFKKFEATPTFERTLEKNIAPLQKGWQPRYYANLFPRLAAAGPHPSSHAQSKDTEGKKSMGTAGSPLIGDVVQNYCEGLEWTLRYYTHGCPDWRWTYKYAYPPLLEDLCKTLDQACPVIELDPSCNPVNPLTQLCSVLPQAGLIYLPDSLREALLNEYPQWYATDCCFLWAYCRYFWESHVVMEHIDMAKLETLIVADALSKTK